MLGKKQGQISFGELETALPFHYNRLQELEDLVQTHPFTLDFIRTTCRAAQGKAILANVEMNGALIVTVA